MKQLNGSDYQLLVNILTLNEEGLIRVLAKYLKRKYDVVHASESYLYAEGDIPIALVAHMDTVYESPPKDIYYDKAKGVIWSPDGLGADDRAGIFAILKILLTTDLRPTIIFTTGEEIGGIGAGKLVKDFKEPTVPINFLIELDRNGINDCVFYKGDNPEFVNFIESFGFSEDWGSFSDISVISPAWQIMGVNLSIGYKNEHSYSELLFVPHMLNTIAKVEKILELPDSEIPHFKYIECKYGYFDDLIPSDEYLLYDYIEECKQCGDIAYTYELIPVRSKRNNDEIEYICGECASEIVNWCAQCGNPYLVYDEGATANLCPYCNEGKKKRK